MGVGGQWSRAPPLPHSSQLPLPQRPSPENLRLESRAAFLPLPPALLEGPAWPLAPATYGLRFRCTSGAPRRPGRAWARAASRQPAPVLAVPEGRRCRPCGVGWYPGFGRTPGRRPGCHHLGQSIKNVPKCFFGRDCPWAAGALPGDLPRVLCGPGGPWPEALRVQRRKREAQ